MQKKYILISTNKEYGGSMPMIVMWCPKFSKSTASIVINLIIYFPYYLKDL